MERTVQQPRHCFRNRQKKLAVMTCSSWLDKRCYFLISLISGDRNKVLGAQNKSSAAQKRYRERQKDKMEIYKQQVEELSKKLRNLQTQNETLEERNRLLEKVVQLKDKKGPAIEEASPEPENNKNLFTNTRTYLAAADFFNTVRRNEKPVTLQEAARISPEDLRQVRLDYIKELAKMLLSIGHGEDPEAMRQMEDYVLSVRLTSINLIQSMSVRTFAHMLVVKKRICQTSFVSERIMTALNLSWDQKRDYVKARQALLARNEAIREKRRELVGKIEQAIPGAAPLMSGQKAIMLNACESSDQFKASLEEEHRSMGQFHVDCLQVLTPLQEARALIEAHPGSPDHWLISGYLEAEQKGVLNSWLHEHLGKSEQISSGVTSNPNQQQSQHFRVVSEPEIDENDYGFEPVKPTVPEQLLPCQQMNEVPDSTPSLPIREDPQWPQKQWLNLPQNFAQNGTDIPQNFQQNGNDMPQSFPENGNTTTQNFQQNGNEMPRTFTRNGSDIPQNFQPNSNGVAHQSTSDSDQTSQHFFVQQSMHQGQYSDQSQCLDQTPAIYKQEPNNFAGFMDTSTMGPIVSLNQVDSTNAMQNSQAGLQTLLDAPSLDLLDTLPDFQEDDMWLDLFPGLLTQS